MFACALISEAAARSWRMRSFPLASFSLATGLAAASEIKAQANIELLVKAAEDALHANDFIAAANNYRLALSHREDPMLRMKFVEVDSRARVLRFDKNIGPARAAEREQRWADAAHFYERAYEARPDAEVAARAAHALRIASGDLSRAATLARQAVSLDGNNIAHHITLVEVLIGAKRFAEADDAAASALSLAPKDARLKELSAAIAKKLKA